MLACAIFVVAYALIATERIHRVSAAIGGVAVMAFVGVTDTETAFGSPTDPEHSWRFNYWIVR